MAIWQGFKATLSACGSCLNATCTPLASTLWLIVNKIWTAAKSILQIIWAVLKWLATAFWNVSRGINPIDCESKYVLLRNYRMPISWPSRKRAYHSLLALCIALIVTNLADVWCIEHISLMSSLWSKVVIYVPSIVVLIFWAYIMSLWIFTNIIKDIPTKWTQNENKYSKQFLYHSFGQRPKP